MQAGTLRWVTWVHVGSAQQVLALQSSTSSKLWWVTARTAALSVTLSPSLPLSLSQSGKARHNCSNVRSTGQVWHATVFLPGRGTVVVG
jgi:hypothetical protein